MNLTRYKVRKGLGVCVRCGERAWTKPDGTLSALCGDHLRIQGGYFKTRKPHDGPEALPSQVEPKRAAYVSDREPLRPPIPKACPRCRNILMTADGETWCYACGFRLNPIPCNDPPIFGAQLPVVQS